MTSICCENAPRSAFGKECSEKRIRGRDGLRVAVSKRDVLPHLEWQLTWVILNEPDNFWKLSGRSSRWNNSLSRRPAEVGIYMKKKVIKKKETTLSTWKKHVFTIAWCLTFINSHLCTQVIKLCICSIGQKTRFMLQVGCDGHCERRME